MLQTVLSMPLPELAGMDSREMEAPLLRPAWQDFPA